MDDYEPKQTELDELRTRVVATEYMMRELLLFVTLTHTETPEDADKLAHQLVLQAQQKAAANDN